jgi:hypothetical protein
MEPASPCLASVAACRDSRRGEIGRIGGWSSGDAVELALDPGLTWSDMSSRTTLALAGGASESGEAEADIIER